jgi:hypothetical protein
MPNEIDDWVAKPMEEKERIIQRERQTDRLKMIESSISSLDGLLRNFQISEEDRLLFRVYLEEILRSVHTKYDEGV